MGTDESLGALRRGAPLAIVAVDAGVVAKSREVEQAVAEGRAIAWMTKADLGATLGEKTVAICVVRHAGIAGQLRLCALRLTRARRRREKVHDAAAGSGGSMSSKVRVYEVAKQLNLDPKQVVGLFQAIGVAESATT